MMANELADRLNELPHSDMLLSYRQAIEDVRFEIRELRDTMNRGFDRMEARLNRLASGTRRLDASVCRTYLSFGESVRPQRERLAAALSDLRRRMTRLEQHLEDYAELTRINAQKIDNWVERLITVETVTKSRRRRAS